MVDADRIATIGYCFGGTCALYMARQNMPIRGVVTFHGGLAGGDPKRTAPIKPSILVCHGADDKFESPEEVSAFMEEMRSSKADWQFNIYSGAVHAFTNPDADKFGIPGVAYNKLADERSWRAMKDFLSEILK
jgi:dienelactone hydrolase